MSTVLIVLLLVLLLGGGGYYGHRSYGGAGLGGVVGLVLVVVLILWLLGAIGGAPIVCTTGAGTGCGGLPTAARAFPGQARHTGTIRRPARAPIWRSPRPDPPARRRPT